MGQVIKLDVVRSLRASKQQVTVTPPSAPHHLIRAGIELQQADFVRQVGEMLTKRIVDTQMPLPVDVGVVLRLAYFALRGDHRPGGIE